MKGMFVAFEGIDGSGKTSLTNTVAAAFEKLGRKVVIVRTKNDVQERVFQRFIQNFEIAPDSIAYMFLFQAMHEKKRERVERMIQEGAVVIADR